MLASFISVVRVKGVFLGVRELSPLSLWVFLGVGVYSSDSGVMCSALVSVVGSVLSLLNSEMTSRPLISARVPAVVCSKSLVSGYMDFMGGGPNSFHWFRPCVNADSMAPVSSIFSSIMLKE